MEIWFAGFVMNFVVVSPEKPVYQFCLHDNFFTCKYSYHFCTCYYSFSDFLYFGCEYLTTSFESSDKIKQNAEPLNQSKDLNILSNFGSIHLVVICYYFMRTFPGYNRGEFRYIKHIYQKVPILYQACYLGMS